MRNSVSRDHRPRSLGACLALVFLIGGAASARSDPEAEPPYGVYIVDPPISNRAIRPGVPLPDTCRPGSELRITACRGEYEPCSFVVETDHPLKQVDVEVGPLRGAAGVIAATAVDVRAVEPVFRRITDFPGILNWLLLHDPTLVEMRDEPQPMALKEDAPPTHQAYTKTMYFTREPVDTPILQPADITTRRQFWLTVQVPESARAGTYRTTLAVVPQNARREELTLVLEVPDFDLRPPPFEYSVYYPAWLEGGPVQVDNPQGYVVLNEEHYYNDLVNMVAHGCMNPTIYPTPGTQPDGSLDFTLFEKVLALREKAGMRGSDLYVLDGPIQAAGKIDAEQYQSNVRRTREFVQWIRQRGYENLYLMGADEATGERLMEQREAWQSIHEGGGRIFVAHYAGYTEGIGDLLDLPIMLHPMHGALDAQNKMPGEEFLTFPRVIQEAVDLNKLLTPEYRDEKIGRVHEHGYKIYTYMDPMAGYTLPLLHRRARGLGLWKCGLDGTMTWSYSHITEPPYTQPGPMDVNLFNFVVRGKEAPFDTLSWEAYREGYDDARYLATLEDALDRAEKAGRHQSVVAATRAWLDRLTVNADLNAWRQDMIRQTQLLLK